MRKLLKMRIKEFSWDKFVFDPIPDFRYSTANLRRMGVEKPSLAIALRGSIKE
jgi:hypothetical protein